MPYDSLLAVGYDAPTLPFLGTTSGDLVNESLLLTAANPTRSITVEIPREMDVYLADVVGTIQAASVNLVTSFTFKLNNQTLSFNSTVSDQALVPFVVVRTSTGSILRVYKGDIFKLECAATGLAGGNTVTCTGSLAVYGKFV